MERSLLNVCLFFKRFFIKIVYFSELWFGLHSLGSFVFELLSKACAVVLLIKLVSWCINAESGNHCVVFIPQRMKPLSFDV